MPKFPKGLYKDSNPIDQPEGTYRDARNAILTREQGSIGNEGGTKFEDSLPTGHELLGSAIAHDGRVVLFSVKSSDGTGSTIGIYNNGSYSSVVTDSDFSFPVGADIQALVNINDKQELIVYWTDNVNPPRYYNLDDPTSYSDPDELNIFNFVSNPPKVDIDGVNDGGGSLDSGAYYFAVAYEDLDGNRTNFITVSHPVYLNDEVSTVTSEERDGAPSGTPTGKSISLTISNIDTSYERLIVAAIPKTGGVFGEVKILPRKIISGSSTSFTYTGNESAIESSIQEITANKASYLTAKTMAQHDGILYMGNLTKKPDIGYQKFANNIKVKLMEVSAADDIYRRSADSFTLKGFQRDEVYAFYISFILKGGEETKAYHIPGREAVGSETDVSGTADVLDIDPSGKNFQFESTGDGTYGMGYWENENEVYPSDENWDIYDVDSNGDPEDTGSSLQGEPVRHHHFPDASDSPFYEGGSTINIASFRLQDVKIPSSIIKDVVAAKVYYAKRTPNNTRILDQVGTIPMDVVDKEGEFVFMSALPDKDTTTALTTDIVGFTPFHLMRSGIDVGAMTHLRGIGILNGDATHNGTYTDGTLVDTNEALSAMPTDEEYRKIRTKAFADNHKKLIDLQSKGFTRNGRTYQSEAKLFVELDDDITLDFNMNTGAGIAVWDYLYNLCSHKVDLYNSFDQQELVFTGYLETNLDWFDPTTPTPSQESGGGVAATHATAEVTVLNDSSTTAGSDGIEIIYPQGGTGFTFGGYANLTKQEIADKLVSDINNSGLNISASSLGGDDPVVEIIADVAGTSENGNEAVFNVPVGIEGNGNILSDYSPELNGGSDGVESQPPRSDFESASVFGGDTYIGRLGMRFTEEGTSGSERKIILYSVVESKDNITWRYEGGEGELYYPKSNATQVFSMEENDNETNDAIFYTNFLGYDPSHSAQADIKSALPFPKDFQDLTDFPTRIIRGRQSEQSDTARNVNFRTFLANDFLDLPAQYGELTRISVVSNAIIPHMESGILRTKGREELVTGDIRAFIGAGDIFSVRPDEFISVEEGYGGLQDIKGAIATEYGYYFVDQNNKEIFELSGQGLSKLSEKGVRNFLQDNIDSGDILTVYDPKYDRILFSQDSWTLSYYPREGIWGSFHEYYPDRFIKGKTNFLSVVGSSIYSHNNNAEPGNFYGTTKKFDIEFVANQQANTPKHLVNIEFITHSVNQDSVSASPEFSKYPEFKDTFDQIRVLNDHRDSGFQDLIYFDQANGNIRQVEGIWRVNKLRDYLVAEKLISGSPSWIGGDSVWRDDFTDLIPNKNYKAEVSIDSGTGDLELYGKEPYDNSYTLLDSTSYDASGGAVDVEASANIGDRTEVRVEITGSGDGASVTSNLRGYKVPNSDKPWQNRGRFIGPYSRILLRYNNSANNLLYLIRANANFKQSIR